MIDLESSKVQAPLFSKQAFFYARWIVFGLLLTLPFTRLMSGINLIFFTLLAWLFLISYWNRKYIPTSLIFFTIIANFYFFASFLNVFPSAWTKYFVIKAIPQQALFVYSLLPMFYLFFTFTLYYLHSTKKLEQLIKIILIFLLLDKIIHAALNGFEPQFFFSVAGLGNTAALAVFAFGLLIANTDNLRWKLFILILFAAMSFYSPFSQNKVYALLFVWILLVPKYSLLTLIAFIFSTVFFYVFFVNDPMVVRQIDQNLTVRLVLLQDAINGFFESHMIGVGYGTESLSNYYILFKNPTFQNVDEAGFMHISVHNSFATMFFRLGILGAGAFIAFLITIVFAIKSVKKNRELMVVFFLCFYIVAFQNPALESFGYMIGTFLMLGSIWALYFSEKNSLSHIESI
ncbi:MAG: hypothetical protein OCD00_13070 [Colwellia sp.]